MLRLVSEVPVQEDTLMRVMIIGLTRELGVNAADALELADQLIRRAAMLSNEGIKDPRVYGHSLLPPATKLGQGYVFTRVCDSVHRGVCLSACWDTHPPARRPPPGKAELPPGKENPLARRPPLARQTPPCAVHAGRYGQQVGGMHPTGMHFLFSIYISLIKCGFSKKKVLKIWPLIWVHYHEIIIVKWKNCLSQQNV